MQWRNPIIVTTKRDHQYKKEKLAPYRTDGRLFTTDVCAKLEVTSHNN